MLNWVLGRKAGKAKAGKRPSYEEAKKIAQSEDVEIRRRLARHEDLEPELLYYFASDVAPEVRRAVAENPGTPLQADIILAKDPDAEVRQRLAHKIGRLVPNLTAAESEKLVELALKVVDLLARDDLPRVRATVADELKQATNIPPDLVRRLSRDIEEIVAAPVIEYSPLLNDDDLLDIITAGATGKCLMAVARRRELAALVAKALVMAGDVEAVAALLRNATARIDDQTLEGIADGAERQPAWHEPLVHRENMPVRVVLRIATFVSAALLDILIDHHACQDTTECLDRLRATLRERIARGDFAEQGEGWESAEDRAKRLHQRGKLDDDALRDALDAGDYAFVRHALVLMSGLGQAVVQKMLNTRNAKSVVTLSWKSGLSAATAVTLQERLARVDPKTLLRPGPDGGYALSESDFEWYLDFFE